MDMVMNSQELNLVNKVIEGYDHLRSLDEDSPNTTEEEVGRILEGICFDRSRLRREYGIEILVKRDSNSVIIKRFK